MTATGDPHHLWVVVMYRLVFFIAQVEPDLAQTATQPRESIMVFIYLHISAMFLAVALSVGSELVLQRVAASQAAGRKKFSREPRRIKVTCRRRN